MDKELRKRLEEAARKEIPDILRINGNYVESFITGFCFGGEWMFNEVIAQAKEWLKNTEHFYQGGSEEYPDVISVFDTIEEMLTNFEADMNKLL